MIGISIFKDKMGYCNYPTNYGVNYNECILTNQKWIVSPWNFDTIQNSIITIFSFSTLEGYDNFFKFFIDSNNRDKGPMQNNHFWTLFYLIPTLYISCYLCIEIFVGFVFINFVMAFKENSSSILTT
jgi:hypothetical protein